MHPANQRRNIRLTVLVLVFLAFLGPMLLAYNLFQQRDALDFGAKHQGVLLQPPPQARAIPLRDPQETIGELMDRHPGHWWLVALTHMNSRNNQAMLTHLGEVHTALAKEASRVRVLILAPEGGPQYILGPSWHHAYASIDVLKQHFYPYLDAREVEGMVVMDPLGNMVLSYPHDQPPKGLFADLKHLLRVSQIG